MKTHTIHQLCLVPLICEFWTSVQSIELNQDVDALLRSAKRISTAWPWQPELPEVARVARHGLNAAPILVRYLAFDSSARWEDERFDVYVEQQIELVLCRLAGVKPEAGKTVFGIRSSDEANITVTRFWRSWCESARKGGKRRM